MPTTATPAKLRGMVATGTAGKNTLGYIVWFSVPDESTPIRRLRKHWQLAGLDPKPLPRDQRAVNIFKRAVRDQAGIAHNEIDGTVTETDVRDVVENEQDVIYQVSRVVRDVDEKVVRYRAALRVWYSKVTEEIKFKPLGEVSRAEVLPIMEAIQDSFDKNAKTVTGAKVRTLVRSYIKNEPEEADGLVGLGGENLRGKAGGVYFVLAKHVDELENLAEFLNALYEPSGRAYLHMVPMADDATQRELLRRHHIDNSIAEIEAAMGDARELLREGRAREVRENVVKFHWRRLERLRRHAAQYNAVLEEEQDDVTHHLDLLNKQLRKLMSL